MEINGTNKLPRLDETHSPTHRRSGLMTATLQSMAGPVKRPAPQK